MDMRCFVNLIGHLGKDPVITDYKYLDKKSKQTVNSQLVELSIATNHLPKATWHTVVGYGDFNVKHLGQLKAKEKLMVSGYLRYDVVGEGDAKRTFTKIIVQGFELMSRQLSRAAEVN